MFRTSRRTYKEYKFVMDVANIVIAILVLCCIVLTFFKVVRPMFFFPVIFYLGTIMNIMACVRSFLDNNKLVGAGMAVISFLMLVVSVYATFLYWI